MKTPAGTPLVHERLPERVDVTASAEGHATGALPQSQRPVGLDDRPSPDGQDEREPSKSYNDARFQPSTDTGHAPLHATAPNVRATKKAAVPGTAPKAYYGKYGSSKPIPQKVRCRKCFPNFLIVRLHFLKIDIRASGVIIEIVVHIYFLNLT